MIETYVSLDYLNDKFNESFMEQGARTLNNPCTRDEHDFFPFPIEPFTIYIIHKQTETT